jgi:GT2 family glycosyltransferase
MRKIAIVILNFNGRDYLEKFLPSVLAHSPNGSVIVADNASSDDSVPFLKAQFPEVELIEMHENWGFAGGYNMALNQVEAEYYVLLNSDVEVTPNWTESILQLMKQDKSIAACQPKILSYHHKEQFEYAGAAGGYIDALGFPFCRGRIFHELEEDQGQYDDMRQIFWATGACLFIRSEIYHQMGGLDEDFFAHMEEIDLCWRINNAGYKIYYEGQSAVFHVGGGTLHKSNPRKTYLNFRNGLTLLFKNLPKRQLIWKLPFRLLLDYVAALKFLLADSGQDAKAVIKAHRDFFRYLYLYKAKRRMARKFHKNDQKSAVIYRRLIIVDHFLFKKKRFDELEFSPPGNHKSSQTA